MLLIVCLLVMIMMLLLLLLLLMMVEVLLLLLVGLRGEGQGKLLLLLLLRLLLYWWRRLAVRKWNVAWADIVVSPNVRIHCVRIQIHQGAAGVGWVCRRTDHDHNSPSGALTERVGRGKGHGPLAEAIRQLGSPWGAHRAAQTNWKPIDLGAGLGQQYD